MKSKHTKGPWFHSYRERPNGTYAEEVYDDKGETIAICAWYSVHLDNEANEANAQLIAAAPDMAEALQEMMGVFKNVLDDPTRAKEFSCYKKAKAALKKAGGLSNET